MRTKEINKLKKKMEIRSLSGVGLDTIYKAFSQAFADYDFQFSREQLQAILKRRGFVSDLSFAAFDKDEIVAFTLNGIGNFNGIPTAYDTGTGTLKDYRGMGLATRVFEYSIPYLKEKNIQQYLLEVLQHNTKAVSVYRNIGFEVTREFNYFNQRNEHINSEIKSLETPYSIQQIDINTISSLTGFWDFSPSWQNDFESIQRAIEGFVSLGVFTDHKLIGYCVFEPSSGDLTQIAVAKSYRRKGVGTQLLQEIIKLNSNESIKVINTDIGYDSITNFLQAKNILLRGKQFEMIKKL
ncbi:GNAT family N-acetyltransferase [Limibacter armeniacum]|uniref:GNAT family N-acetyltransferase n=1 Tax=Limibacter armeniacum TaxID=466084 RepID=UPI002FE62C57